jgi:hypothetical protein
MEMIDLIIKYLRYGDARSAKYLLMGARNSTELTSWLNDLARCEGGVDEYGARFSLFDKLRYIITAKELAFIYKKLEAKEEVR